MKKILTLWVLIIAVHASAYDFMADGIAYNVNSNGNTVTVTFTAFSNNYPGVTAINIPERVTRNKTEYRVTAIGSYAFYECTALTSIIIPNTVTTIGEYGIFGCEALNTLEIGNNVSTIGRYAFSGTAIKSLYLPGSVSVVNDYAFADCASLTSAVVGNGVTKLGRSVFEGCTALTSVNLGVKLVDIGNSCFSGCTKMGRIVCAMPEPPEISPSVFNGVNKSSCRLYVPQGAVTLYSTMEVWMDFTNLTDEYAGYQIIAADLDCIRGRHEVSQGVQRDTLAIELSNETAVTALELVLTLPQGVTFAMNGNEPEIWLSTERKARDHNVTHTGTNRESRILVSSPSGKALNGFSGPVCYAVVNVGNTNAGSYTVRVTHASIAMPNSDWMNLPDADSRLRVGFLLGDANGDGAVDVADYVVTAARLVNRPACRFFTDAADVNRNGSIDLGDLVGITQRATGQVAIETVF
jgi:hypothetical protein